MKQDLAMFVGIALFVGGIATISRAAAAIVLGIIFMFWAYVTATKSPPPKV